MKAILSSRERIEGRDLVFGKRVEAIAGWGWRKHRLDTAIGDKIKVPWTFHDIRRSCASRMADIGILPHVIEAALNHQSGTKRGVAGIYNRSTYAREKKQALDLWGDHVVSVVENRESNIMSFRGNAS
jgi:integrase